MTQDAFNEIYSRAAKLIPKDMDIVDLLHMDPIIERKVYQMEVPVIKVKYHVPEMTKLEYNPKGNFYDLRSSVEYHIRKGDFLLIDLGVSIKLPEGYWAQIVPRSSLFKKHCLVQPNSFGVIDNTYCGEDDHWMLPVYALEDTIIKFDERICQFRIVKDNYFMIQEVDHMDDESRGGFGSTGEM
ncbi:MAG: deoxyuridine 5'-triphosphate nucleotidohydrolase [Acholeplasmatales bacterium]|nr:deoxyuridine 5'-triphosphate nucleotidohydrolase [Acholeplasmatales bacterium]